MKLSQWAQEQGVSYKTAYRLVSSNRFPGTVKRLPTGTILVFDDVAESGQVVLYARVSSHDQKEDLERQVHRLRAFCASRGLKIDKEISEIGSGLNGKRKQILKLLGDLTITCLVVEHRDRLGRFGTEMVEACLKATGRSLLVVNESECKDDIVQDFVDVVTSMCARIYGRRSAKNRAKKAIQAANENQPGIQD